MNVRTVGDLTPNIVGRVEVAITDGDMRIIGPLVGLNADAEMTSPVLASGTVVALTVTIGTMQLHRLPLSTPCEVVL